MNGNCSILVTGGAGYLGSIMVPDLLADGHEVTVLDNFLYRQNSLSHVCHLENFEIIKGDCRDESLISGLVGKFDVVIPLAALVGAPVCDIDQIGAVTTNRDAMEMLVQTMGKEQRMLVPITNSGYGIGEKDQPCTEDSPLRPLSLYGRTKVEAEEIALTRENALSFRLATVFGMAPRMRTDLLVNDFVYRAVNDRAVTLFEPHFRRNYIHIRDVSSVFKFGIRNFEDMKGQPYNVGLSDANLTKQQLCEKIKSRIPNFVFQEAAIGEDPDKRDYVVSNARIEALGFRPDYSIDDGISELIKGYAMIKNNTYSNI